MTIQADADLSVVASLNGLSAVLGGLCDRLDRRAQIIQRANQAIRQIPFQANVVISGGTGSLNPSPNGPDVGYYWSVRRLTAQGYSAGTVTAYFDNTNGEPLVPWTQAGVFTFGKGEQLMHPGSSVAVNCTGITSTNNLVTIYGTVDCLETWLLPFYLGGFGEGF